MTRMENVTREYEANKVKEAKKDFVETQKALNQEQI